LCYEGQRTAVIVYNASATRGLVVDESRVLVTRGTQGALAAIAHGLLRPATSSRSRIRAIDARGR
jgi:DNA-binding transcriptional MocR family regulator